MANNDSLYISDANTRILLEYNMYHRQQNKWKMKFDRSNKFDLCYYGEVNSRQIKSSVASKWASKYLWY